MIEKENAYKDIKVLCLDDSSTMRRIISNTLFRVGVQKENLELAEDGAIGLEIFRQDPQRFDIVLTDINMPVMDGYGFIQNARRRNADVPIVCITTEGGKGEIIRALKMGATNYIIKPFTPQILKEKLSKIIEGL